MQGSIFKAIVEMMDNGGSFSRGERYDLSGGKSRDSHGKVAVCVPI